MRRGREGKEGKREREGWRERGWDRGREGQREKKRERGRKGAKEKGETQSSASFACGCQPLCIGRQYFVAVCNTSVICPFLHVNLMMFVSL